MADDIMVGSVAVDIVPDTRKFAPELKAKLQGLKVDIGVNADTTGIRADLDEITRTRDVRIVANAEVAEATGQLDIAARDRTTTIRANVDKSQIGAVGTLSKSLGGISGFATSIITLGPALIPILAVVAGIGVALGAPLAIAAGGATVFGFLAGFAVKDTTKQLAAIDKASAKLSTLKKGTAAYAAAQADLKAKQDALSPAQKRFADSLDHIKGAFADLLSGKVGGQLLGPVSAFLTLAADLLPKMTPIIGAVSGALTTLLGDLGNAVKGPDFRAFINTFSQQVGPDIVAFGHIAGGVFKGVAGLVTSLGQAFGPGLLKGIQSLTDKFGDLGQSAGKSQKLQDFVDYFHKVGPQVGSTISAVAKAVGHFVEALAPLGPPALKVVEGIADAISGIPVPVLTALAGAFIAMLAVSKASKGVGAVAGLFGGKGLSGGGGGILGLARSAKPIPVFVVNEGFGAGGSGGFLGNAKKGLPFIGGTLGEAATGVGLGAGLLISGDELSKALNASPLTSLPALLGVAVEEKRGIEKLGDFFFHRKPSTSPGGAESPGDVQAVIDLRRADIPQIRATSTQLDAIRAHAQRASTSLDLIGHSATRNFGSATADIATFNAKLEAIKDKRLRIILQDQAAVRSLEALQAFRLRDKTLTVNEIERIVGPGGGIGQPAAPRVTPRSTPRVTVPSSTPRTQSGSQGASGPLVNIEHASVADTNDLLRKAGNALRARAGGGVMLRPGSTAVFG